MVTGLFRFLFGAKTFLVGALHSLEIVSDFRIWKSFVESCQNLEETIAFRCEEWTDTMSTLVQVKSSYTGTSDGCGGSLENLKKRSQVGMVIFGQCLKKSLEHTLDIVLLCITTINTINSISVQIFGTGRTRTFTTFDWS